MSEWWTYRLSDFLLFSPQTYYRLFELYNAAIWPAQVVTLLLGLAILLLLRRPSAARGRVIAGILAVWWVWIAVAFHLQRYATIHTAAKYFAWGFLLQAALLIWSGGLRGSLRFDAGSDRVSRAGLWIFLFALFVQPLIGPAVGRSWRQLEIFGVAPDPTAVATLGLLLLVSGRTRLELLLLPLLWCAISGVTLWGLDAPDRWLMPGAGAVCLALAVGKRGAGRQRRRS